MAEGILEVRAESDLLIAGEPFEGTVMVSLGDNWEVAHAGVILRWTAGNDHIATEVDAVWQELAPAGTQMNPSVAVGFEMIAPVMPWSFTGRQVRVSWSIGALVKPRGGELLDAWRLVQLRPPSGNWSPRPLSSTSQPII